MSWYVASYGQPCYKKENVSMAFIHKKTKEALWHGCIGIFHLLECVELILPSPVEFQSHLDASKDHLLAPFEVDAELDNIPVVNRESLALL